MNEPESHTHMDVWPSMRARIGLAGWIVIALAWGGLTPELQAQEATSDEPGVIQRGESDSDDEESEENEGDDRPQAQEEQERSSGNQPSSGQQQGGDSNQPPEQQGQVITPDNASPNEKYNLPPNFDPNYQPSSAPDNVEVTIDFREAKLEEVVKFFSGAMKKNFIIANSIQSNKTITIISPEDVTLAEAYRAFLAALEMNGLTLVKMGDFHKIVQSKQAISEPGPTYDEDDRIPNEARMITAIIPIENASPDEIKNVIGNFTSPAATVLTHRDSLIISENAANVRRIRNLVDRLDKGDAGKQVFIYDVQYADAQKVVDKLKKLFQQQGGGGGRRGQNGGSGKQIAGANIDVSQLIADKRTNQLIIVTDQDSFDRIKDMIELLDVPMKAGGEVHVNFLEYADAEELSSTLSNLVSAAQEATRRGGRGGEAQGGAILQGEVQITAYKPNNALVVVASPNDYTALERVIDTLDRPRRQVYVEAVIMEVSLDANRTLGLGVNTGLGQDFQGVIPDSAVESGAVSGTQGLIVGQSNFPGLSGLTNAISGTGGSIGLLGPLVDIPGTSISLPAFAMLLQATQTDNSVNILSTPSVLTMDNEEAEIVVGERVPFLRGISGGGGGLGGLGGLGGGLGGGTGTGTGTGTNTNLQQLRQAKQGQTQTGTGTGGGLGGGGLGGLGGLAAGGLGGLVSPIDYQDVGLTLRIKPQVNESRYVRLEVDQEVSDIKGAGGTNLTPTQTRRNIQTTVLVKDQSTIVIGGLMRDVQNETIEKVPFLGDIPLLGMLFRKKSTIQTKQNLILMLTPYIIQDESDLQKIYERKIKERKELLRLFGKRDLEYVKKLNFQKKSGLLDRMYSKLDKAIEQQKAREEAREELEQKGPQYKILGNTSPRDDGNDNSNANDNDDSTNGESSSETEANRPNGASSSDSSSSPDTSSDASAQ